MIKVYVSRDDPGAADIVDRLRELVVAHTVVFRDSDPAARSAGGPGREGPRGSDARVLEETAPEEPGPGRIPLPVLVDDDTVVRGREQILAHLDMLELFLGEWSKFQSDACYCDADGNVE